jgi:peptidoglycan biosynthesis protein MviN/MurJ (putative lipid II flippase)
MPEITAYFVKSEYNTRAFYAQHERKKAMNIKYFTWLCHQLTSHKHIPVLKHHVIRVQFKVKVQLKTSALFQPAVSYRLLSQGKVMHHLNIRLGGPHTVTPHLALVRFFKNSMLPQFALAKINKCRPSLWVT